MRLRSNSYHMLIASLPPLPTHFEVDRLPLTAERLRDRLRLLEPEDAEEMGRMMEVLRWRQQFEESNDATVVQRYGELMRKITNRLIHEVLIVGEDRRMVTAALRRRRRGLGPPPVGIGRWLEQIRRNFNRPDFGLTAVFPRLAQVAPLFEQGDVLHVHRALMEGTWGYLRKRADDYYFSFEAVVLYVARWHIISQWCQERQAERGQPIFEALVKEALGEYANVYS
jgi:hypothetical protein